MIGNRLYKKEKLCSTKTIDCLFDKGKGVTAWPLRAVYLVTEGDNTPTRFMISVPKKRHRHAVDRVLLRRRVREAYRLNRPLLNPALNRLGVHVDIVFIYLSPEILPYSTIEHSICSIMNRIVERLSTNDNYKERDKNNL